MAHISRTIEVAEPVGTICQRWTEFERTPLCAIDAVEARIRWRAEVLTFEPCGEGTRLTLRVEYEPGGGDAALPLSIEGMLESFRSFLAEQGGGGAAWAGLGARRDGWRS